MPARRRGSRWRGRRRAPRSVGPATTGGPRHQPCCPPYQSHRRHGRSGEPRLHDRDGARTGRSGPRVPPMLYGATTLGNLRTRGCGPRSLQEPWIDTTTLIGEAMLHHDPVGRDGGADAVRERAGRCSHARRGPHRGARAWPQRPAGQGRSTSGGFHAPVSAAWTVSGISGTGTSGSAGPRRPASSHATKTASTSATTPPLTPAAIGQ